MGNAVNWKRNLAVVWLSQFMGLAGFGCAMPFIPMLLRDKLGIADDAVRGVFVSAFQLCSMLSFSLATFFWGVMADRFGYKIMLLRASFAAAFFFPCMAFAPTVWWLLGIRLVASFFSGTYNAAQTLLVTTTPQERHGFALGTLSTALWSGHMAGFMAGGLIVHYFGYTTAFVICGMMYFTGALLVLFFVHDNFQSRRVSAPVTEKKASPSPKKARLFTPVVLSLLGLFLLMGVARRIDEPFLAMIVEAVHGRAGEAFFTGVVSSVSALGGLLAGIWIGHLCDRCDSRKLLIWLLAGCCVSTLLQAFAPNIAVLLVMRFLAFFAAGGLMPVLQIVLARNTDPEMRGTFFGMSSSVNTTGGVICALLSGVISYRFGVRGVLGTAATLFAVMIPYSLFMFAVIRRARKS